MNEELNELYREIILDHYRYPRGNKHLQEPDVRNEGKNPTCGDEIGMEIKFRGDIVDEIGVRCAGCAICVASGSMLSEAVEGRNISEVKRIASDVKSMITGEETEHSISDLGDLEVLQGVSQFPVRIKCALLAWVTLVDCIEEYESDDKGDAPGGSLQKDAAT